MLGEEFLASTRVPREINSGEEVVICTRGRRTNPEPGAQHTGGEG